jgi:hypothetical protein
VGNANQNVIACGMTTDLVEYLEMVDVDRDDRHKSWLDFLRDSTIRFAGRVAKARKLIIPVSWSDEACSARPFTFSPNRRFRRPISWLCSALVS